MKRLFLAALCALCIPASAAERRELSFSFPFKAGGVSYAPQPDGTELPFLEGTEHPCESPGRPWLPVLDASVKIPVGWRAVAVEAKAALRAIREDIDVTPEQAPVPTDAQGEVPRTPKDAAAYASADPWPAERAVLTGSYRMRGFPFATVRVQPLAYAAARRTLYLADEVEVFVTIEREEEDAPLAAPAAKGAGAKGAAAPFRPGDPSGRFQARLNEMVVNPFMEESAAKGAAPPSTGDRGAAPATCTYLVITGEILAPAFRRLVDFRTKFDGVTAELVTVEEIEAAYDGTRPDGGSDVQTKIRNCIRDYVENRGTEYVCLGGDDTVVPDRDCYGYVDGASGVETCDDMPTDLYYSSLEDDWDGDKDGLYGEPADGCDLAPDVVVGRIPVQTFDQAAGYLRKLFAYERNVRENQDVLGKFYLGGAMSWHYAWSTNSLWPREAEIPTFHDGLRSFAGRTTRASDAEIWLRRLWRDKFGLDEYGLSASFFFDTITSWDSSTDGDYAQTSANVVKRMSEGHHYLFYQTHGNADGWSLEGFNDFSAYAAKDLTGPVDFVYTCACLSGHFDKYDPSLSEAMVRNPNGGTIGWLGCSREGWGSYLSSSSTDYGGDSGRVSPDYGMSFYNQILVQGVPRFGDAVCWGKANHISKCGSVGAPRWLMFGLNAQGDPMAHLYQKHLFGVPRVGTPSVALDGPSASLSVSVESLGALSSFADVWFEVSFDDLSFASPVLVPAGRAISDGAALAATLADVPAGTTFVFVRAHALTDLGREAVSAVASNEMGGDAFDVAIDAPGRAFTNASASPWTVERDASATGGACVRSGAIASNGSTEFSTVVTGPAKVAFRWKVSSEDNYDKLSFYIGSTSMGTISGEKGWERAIFDVPSGTQTLKWVYTKDSSVDKGSDAGWVDAFEFPAQDAAVLPAAAVARVGDVSADGTGKVRATATSLAGASSGALFLEASPSLSFEDAESYSLGTVSEGGSKERTFTGIAPGSTLYVRARIEAGGRTAHSSSVASLFVPGSTLCTISGTVLGRNGKPAELLAVAASPGGYECEVGADGTYSIAVPRGWAGVLSVPGATGVWPAQAAVSTGTDASVTQDFVVDHVLRVRAGATGAGDGSSWADAYPSLADAISRCQLEAYFGSGATWREIWVATGTYSPGSVPEASFGTPAGLEVYGGFAGTETGRSQRNWIANRTILSGEIGDPSRTDDDTRTLVTGPPSGGYARWDGFVFTGARRTAVDASNGDYSSTADAFVVDHSLFTGNHSTNYYSTVAYGPCYLRNCVVTGNTYDYRYEYAGIFRTVNLDHCSVFGNTCTGGPVAEDGSYRNTVIWGNTVSGVSYHTQHNSYYTGNASCPYEGYGTTVWIGQKPQVKIGTYLSSDPGFATDPATGLACALGASSYAVDRGRTIDWMTADSLDYLGNPRVAGSAPDLGAVEYIPSGTATAPRFAAEEISGVGFDSVTVSATLSALGTGSTWADVAVQVSASPSFGNIAASATVRAAAAGTPVSATLSGLAGNTAYYVRFAATGSNGLVANGDTLFFATPDRAAPSGSFALGTPGVDEIPVSWRLDSIGYGNSSAALFLDYGTTAEFGSTKEIGTGSVAASGSAVLDGLDPATTYRVRLRIVASPSGRVFLSDPASATTRDHGAPAVSAAKGAATHSSVAFAWSLSDLGYGAQSATVRAEISTSAAFPASLTETIVLAEGVASPVSGRAATISGLWPETAYYVRVVAVNDGGKAATTATMAFETPARTLETKGWFFVDLSDAGYAAFPNVSGVAAPGGTWSGAANFGAAHSASDRTLALSLAEGAAAESELRYTPTSPSAAGCDAEVRGSVVATPSRSLAALPAPDGALAGIAFVRGSSGLTPCGYAGGGWTALAPAVAADAAVEWRALFDFSSPASPRVRYAIDGTTNGWLALPSGTRLSAVGFRGDQTLGSFRGLYFRIVEELEFRRPAFAGGDAAPSLDPATGAFAVHVSEMETGVYYTVFSAASLDGAFTAVAASTKATAAHAANGLDVSCPPKGDGSTLFVKIVASDEPFSLGDPFPSDAQ